MGVNNNWLVAPARGRHRSERPLQGHCFALTSARFQRRQDGSPLMTSSAAPTPTALVVAHPGHEVRVYGWLELTRPLVFILTDGSGRAGESRLPATTRLLAEIGSRRGPVYGRFTERAFYDSVLNQELPFFLRLAEELAAAFGREGIERVAGDAAEGYNSTHDVCRLLVNAAVEMANRSGSARIANYDFPVAGNPDACPEALRAEALRVHLDDDAFARKLAAARKYYPELLAEVQEAYGGGGGPLLEYLRAEADAPVHPPGGGALEVFRVECLRPVRGTGRYGELFSEPPFYERYGERQVAAGLFERVIRYREHLVPVAESLRRHAGG